MGRPVVGFQDWRDMLFVHWPVPPSVVRARIPPTLEVDCFAGDAWITLLPFTVLHGRPRGLPAALGLDFLEVNLRTYVRHRGEPGIWFFSLDATSPLAVLGARALFGLPYVAARIANADGWWRLRRNVGGDLAIRAEVGACEDLAPEGSLASFLLERYALFVQRRRALVRERVRHGPYRYGDARIAHLEEDLAARAGIPPGVRGPPIAHASPGVDVAFLLPKVVERAHVGSDLALRTPVRP